MIPTLAQLGKRTWMPDSASTFGPDIDFLFYFIYWISAAAFILIIAAMIYLVLRYRHRPGAPERPPGAAPAAHSTTLELTWSIVPSIAMAFMFWYGFRGFVDMNTPPDYAMEVQVTGIKWAWTFTYPNGASSPDLHVPKDRAVKLILSSQDVIHSIFVPAFRMKKDVVPGRYNIIWVKADADAPVRSDGQNYFDLYCTEYCGTNHSNMRSRVFVHDSTSFTKWLDEAANWIKDAKPVDAGKRLYNEKGCAQCHSTDEGKVIVGPSFKNNYGHIHDMRDGSKVTVDENYIRESILVPGAKVRAGFENVMPSFQGRLKDIEITAIIEWLKSQSDKGPKPLDEFPNLDAKPGESKPGDAKPAEAADASAPSNAPSNVEKH
ncbi:MAG: cytochrome c oxidase subunit II [Planctomycetota bacterium]|nr:cytochrome c oxidase subunit II [Planctomycetota bacterium]